MKRDMIRWGFIALALVMLGSCASSDDRRSDTSAADKIQRVQNLVVIYAENRAFDNLYGNFPGARGLSEVVDANGKPTPAYAPQKDRDGTVLPRLPQTWGGVTAAGVWPVVTQAQSANLPNAPFSIETAFTPASGAHLDLTTTTRDLYHRFYENQMQIGTNGDGFAAWTDAGGLTMGHFDTSGSAIYGLARKYVLADDFFQGAFGGSFLNHQYLICACAPEYPHADTAAAKPTITVLDKDASGHYLPRLTTAASSPASALDGPPTFVRSGNITPADYFGDGKFYAVNTMQPPYQPSGNPPAGTDGDDLLYARATAATTLPPQTQTTIGDLLNAKGVSWKWYSGSWDAAVADGTRPAPAARTIIYAPPSARASPDFQAHHQPFNYYADLDPVAHAADRAMHLKDYRDLVTDAAAGTLPAVSFYKPQGNFNQHAGYANVADGDTHIAQLVATLQASPQYRNMMIVITYDEFGGVWDHVTPPKGDKLGPGTRIGAIVISPLGKTGVVDHTQYDTGSIVRFITRRWGLPTLSGIAARDAALKANGAQPMGDLSNTLR
jgi:acid phosphatase